MHQRISKQIIRAYLRNPSTLKSPLTHMSPLYNLICQNVFSQNVCFDQFQAKRIQTKLSTIDFPINGSLLLGVKRDLDALEVYYAFVNQ